jgi:DinB superfamily
MTRVTSGRPASSEYIPHYEPYISRVPDGDIVEILAVQLEATLAFATSLTPDSGMQRSSSGGWRAVEVLGHMADTERIFAYRALRFARGDPAPLPGVDLDAYVAAGGFDRRALADMFAEFATVRRATVTLLRSLDAADWVRCGIADGQPMSVRAIAYTLAGHQAAHIEELSIAAGLLPAGG